MRHLRGSHKSEETTILNADIFKTLQLSLRDLCWPFMATLKPQSTGPLYSNVVVGTMTVDGWAATFGTARRGLDGLRSRPIPSSLYQM